MPDQIKYALTTTRFADDLAAGFKTALTAGFGTGSRPLFDDVLQAAFDHGPVLPFRFGTAVADADTVVRDVLAPSREQLDARLEALDGKVEMQVKATYAEAPLLRSILTTAMRNGG